MKAKTAAAIDKTSGFARNAVIFLAIAVLFRGLGVVQRIGMLDGYCLVTELILPVVFCVLLLVCVLTCGKRFLWISLLPMLFGSLFFISRALSSDHILGITPGAWEILIRIFIYLVVSLFYSAAVLSDYRVKWLLIPAFGLGIVYHLVFEDYPALFRGEVPITFSNAMMELSILFLLLGLLFVSLSLCPAGPVNGKNQEKPEKPNRGFLWRRKKKEPDDSDVTAKQGMPREKAKKEKEENKEENKKEEERAPAAETVSEPVSKPVFDESFFDKPYRPTLTLDPEAAIDTTAAEEK